jgi:hypothetical protein
MTQVFQIDHYEPPGFPAASQKPKFVLERFSEITFNADEEWLIKHVFPRQGVGVLFGKSGSTKSFHAAHIACCVAAGREWAGLKTEQATAVYIAAEGAAGLRKRKAGFVKANPEYPTDAPFHLISTAPNLGTEQGDLESLIDAIEAAGVTPGLIIIDTLAQSLGGGDENGAGMMLFLANATALSSRFKAFVLIVHHVGLSDELRARGHSSLKCGVDAQMLCEREKGSMVATLTLQKQKDEADDRTFAAQLSRVVIGHDSDGDEVSTLVVEHVAESESKPAVAKPKDIPPQQRMLMDVAVAALEESGAPFKPFGAKGPSVHAVDDRAIRLRYFARMAEQADADEDPDKLYERQRKAFNRSVADAIKANRIMAQERDNKRLIWIP